MRLIKSIIILITFLCLWGCGSSPTVIQADFSVSEDVNPDMSGRPSPIVLRIYELKSLGNFEAADFYTLLENYESALGTDLVNTEQFHLSPGETQFYNHTTSAETNFVAVIAAFRKLDKSVWKDSIPIIPKKTTKLLLSLEPLSVKITKK
jgi:type VI secretion system protein VasD